MPAPPGLLHPTVNSFEPGTNNAKDSAIAAQQNMNNKQALLNRSVTGGKSRKGKKRSKLNILDWNKAISGGAAPAPAPVVIPQLPVPYKPAGTDPNNVIKGTSSDSMQAAAYSVNDNQATNMKKGGGNPNWNWGCLSGGRRTKRSTKSRKSRKCKKSKSRRRRH